MSDAPEAEPDAVLLQEGLEVDVVGLDWMWSHGSITAVLEADRLVIVTINENTDDFSQAICLTLTPALAPILTLILNWI